MTTQQLADPDRAELYALLGALLPLEFYEEYVATKELHSSTARQFLLQLCRENADRLSPSTTAKLKLLGGLRGLLNIPSSLCSQVLLDDQTPCLDLDDVIFHYWAKWDANASTKQYATLIFENKPAAVISSLVTRGSFSGLVSPSIQDDVLSILDGLDGDLNLLREPLSNDNPVFESLSDQRRYQVLQFFTSLQQLSQVIIQPTDLPALMSNGFSSIESVAYSPFAAFQALVSRHGIDTGHAKRIHNESKRLQNMAEQVVTSLVLRTSSQALSRVEPAMFSAALPTTADIENKAKGGPSPGQLATNNMSSWFGDLDDMGCPDCCSVTSPAAYFVDLLRFLKTTFASSQPQGSTGLSSGTEPHPNSGAKPPPNSLLAKLFVRRPELGDLLLSCRNTSERVPYIDLVNEILESAVIYLETRKTIDSGLEIDCHNADSHDDFDQDSSSDCSKGRTPRDASNIKYELYDRVISKCVFPSSVFPYSHSLDTLQSYLEASDVSASSLLSHFQPCGGTDNITEEHKREAVARAFAASVLNLTLGDFVALTKESFHTLDAARVATGQPDLSEVEYQEQAGLQPSWHYWGYPDNNIEEGDGAERMLQTEDSLEGDQTGEQLGLTFVKKQLLPRLGESFATLVDLLKTRFMAGSLVITPFSRSPSSSSSTTNGRVATQLQDFRLHSADGGRLTEYALKRLEQIVRLWRRCKQGNEDEKTKNDKAASWSLLDVDDALYAFGEPPKAESLAGESTPEPEGHKIITPETIKEIAAISELARLAKMDPNRVIALFEKSANFLRDLAISKIIARVQPKDMNAITITSQYLPLLLQSLDLAYSDFVQIQADEQLSPDTLITVDTIFLLYRLSTLAKLLQVPYARLPSLLSALRERVGILALSSPQGVLALLNIWQGFTEDGWTAERFISLLDKTPAGEADVLQKTVQFISKVLESPMTMTPSPLADGNTESSLLISQSITAAAQSLVPNQTLDMINVFLNLPTTASLSIRNRAPNTIRDAMSGVLEHVYKTTVTPQGDQLDNSFMLFTQDTTMTIRCTVSQGSDIPKSLQLGPNRICQLAVKETESTGSRTTTTPTQLEGKMTVTISQSESVRPVLYMSWPSELSDVQVTFDVPKSSSERQNAPPLTPPHVIPASMMATVATEVRKLQNYGQLLQQYKLCKEEVQILGLLLFRPSANEVETVQKIHLYSSIRKSLARPGMEVALALLVQWFCVVGQPLGTVKDVACRFSQASLLNQPLAEHLLAANFQVATSEALLSSSATHSTPYERLELLNGMAKQARTLFTLGLKHDSAHLLFAVAQPRPFDQSVASTSPHIALINHLRATLVARGANQALAAAQDKLRNKRRMALIQYLLQHPAMKSRNILDEGNLFEFFLIDVQMSSGLETTRIQQAISTVQLFVHRCLLGAETDIEARLISQDRWSWMQRYTTWEANRRVFLYPESYADPTLRDGKTEIFRSVVEEAAMQNTLDEDVVRKIIRGYVYAADEVANLRIEAACYDPERVKSIDSNQGEGFYHFFARSRNSPYAYFYRSMEHTKRGQSVPSPVWTPWTRIPLEIAGHEVDAEGNALDRSGTYLVPIVWQKRLILFMPRLILRTSTDKQAYGQTTTATVTDGKSSIVQVNNPTKLSIDIKLSWTEQIESVFVAPKQSQVTLNVPATASGHPPAFESFWFEARPSVDKVSVTVYQNQLIDSAGTATSTKCHGEFVLRQDASVTFCELEKMNPIPSLSNSKFLRTQFGSLTRSSSVPESPSKLITRPQNSAVTPTDWPKLPLPDLGTDVTCTSMTWTMNSQSGNRVGIVADTTVASSQVSQPWFLLCSTSTSMPMFNTLADSLRQSLADDQGVDEIYRVMDKSIVSDEGKKANPALVDHGMAFGNSPSLAQCREDATPCAIYNWEAGFHNISLLVERLITLQQFDRAIKIARLVLDPTGSDIVTKGQDWRPVWRFPPFRDSATRAHGTVGSLFNNLEASSGSEDTMDTRIRAWRRSPFQPHAVARNRPLAYMKRFVMKYIEALVAAGDTLFRQNSLELVPLAVQRYIEALHVFGPRPETVTELNPRKTFKSYNQLAESIDDFSNAFVLMHLSFPYYVSLEARGQLAPGGDKSLQGLLQTTYFGIQANKDFVKLRERIDDRLFKIRNSLDINGNPRILSIWDPPINPNDLVKAIATAGGNTDAALRGDTGLVTPTYDCKVLPRKRFAYLLSRAFDLCSELKASSSSLLAAIEKKDGEALQMLRAKQDMGLQRIMSEMKIHQKKEAELGLEQLEQSRGSHVHRLEYYAVLTGDIATVKAPEPDEEFNEIHQIMPPPAEEDLRLTRQEKLELDFAELSSMFGSLAAEKERVAAMNLLVPMPCLNVQFMGLGVSEQLPNWGQVEQMQAATQRAESVKASEESTRASRIAQWTRQLQERRLQLNLAGREIKGVDVQIQSQKARIAAIDVDIRAQQQNSESAAQTLDFLSTKLTNQQLYSWLETNIRATLYQTYLVALELARKVEAVYSFERGPGSSAILSSASSSSFISAAGYWDNSHHGLHAGEQLWLALKQLELAYMSKDESSPPFNITKNISLRQVDPAALLSFRELGDATFQLPELMFDLDFPGHYFRRIQSVAFSIHCIVGPYTTINCTATLMDHKYRASPTSLSAGYAEKPDGRDERFVQDNIKLPIRSIAISSGQHDSGVFDLSFNTDDFQPFEGAGVISTWRLRLPDSTLLKQFDYRSISDVVMHLRYTARDGGDGLRKAATTAAVTSIKAAASPNTTPHSMMIDVKQDAPDSWYSLSLPGSSSSSRAISMRSINERLPYYAKSAAGIKIKSIIIYAAGSDEILQRVTFKIVTQQQRGQREVRLKYADKFGKMSKFTIGAASVTESTQSNEVTIPNPASLDVIKEGPWFLELEDATSKDAVLINPTDILLVIDYYILL